MNAKTRIIVLIITIFSLAGFAQQVKYVKVETENLRTEPNGDKIGLLLQKTPLEVIDVNGKWSKVKIEAWIYSPSLTSDLKEIKDPTPQDLTSAGNGFYYKNVSFREGFMGVRIVGEILNKSDKTYQMSTFKLSAYDISGRLLENADIIIMNFSSGSTKSFDAILTNTNVDKIKTHKIQFGLGL